MLMSLHAARFPGGVGNGERFVEIFFDHVMNLPGNVIIVPKLSVLAGFILHFKIKNMKAIILAQPDGIEELKVMELEKPAPGEGEVLVQVKAISINPVDVKTRAGKGVYGRINTESPIIIGWDIAGVVVEANNAAFKPGDEVFGMVNFPG